VQKNEAEGLHSPVLLTEVVQFLAPERGGVFIDATLGLGGHAEALLEKSSQVRVIGIDQDTEAITYAKERLGKFGDRVQIFHSNFSQLKDIWQQSGAEKPAEKPHGILADLGVSSLQFDSAERGFSFRYDAPLDMRMNAAAATEEDDDDDAEDIETAAELLQRLSEEEIANVIYQYGEERFSRRIARWIVERRERGEPVQTTKELADLVSRAVKKSKHDQIHPATRTFQALRIAVNKELEILADFISDAIDILDATGRLAIISFHSLEDRIVKQTFQKLAGKCFCPPRLPKCICGAEKKVEILTKRPVVPGAEEMAENPRARSAKLRVCSKL
jgi:16S rRNA (cytosine1402-N4)-methyltransferase